MTTMNAISLWNPWAALLFTGAPIGPAPGGRRLGDGVKRHETRSWAPPRKVWGQRIAIHAAKKVVSFDEVMHLQSLMDRLEVDDRMPDVTRRGMILGTMVLESYRKVIMPAEMLTDPTDILCGDWDIGRFVWRMTDAILFDKPIPCVGRQGFFNVDIPDFKEAA
jgi:hypothetical protein